MASTTKTRGRKLDGDGRLRRSQVSSAIQEAIAGFDSVGIKLPPFGTWSLNDWAGLDAAYLIERGLGWDVTDFGQGDFGRIGLVLFTFRNGLPTDPCGYAEKVMYVGDNQLTPWHFHHRKTEDIINRAGATLCVRVRNRTERNTLAAPGGLVVRVDGRAVAASDSPINLGPGESIQIPSGLYHQFWAHGGFVVAGEVSSTNDDLSDNYFLDPGARLPDIDEDEAVTLPLTRTLTQQKEALD